MLQRGEVMTEGWGGRPVNDTEWPGGSKWPGASIVVSATTNVQLDYRGVMVSVGRPPAGLITPHPAGGTKYQQRGAATNVQPRVVDTMGQSGRSVWPRPVPAAIRG